MQARIIQFQQEQQTLPYYFAYHKKERQLIISIKIKWLNLLLAILSIGYIVLILGYLIVENAHHAAV